MSNESTKVTVIVGAGSSLSDAGSNPKTNQPPLDKGFFNSLKEDYALRYYKVVKDYLTKVYGIDPKDKNHDSLEGVMAILYTDINSATQTEVADKAFRSLLHIINRRMSSSTNIINPGKKGNFYRFLRKLLKDKILPKNITILTFNYDIQVEKTISILHNTDTWRKRFGVIFNFPYCYNISDPLTSSPLDTEYKFQLDKEDLGGIKVIKLHGSLNWYSVHESKDPPLDELMDLDRKLYITTRKEININIRRKLPERKTRYYSYPIIVPPIINKAPVLHSKLIALWPGAEDALKKSNHVYIFGYSCPESDYESANLIRRGIKSNKNLKAMSIIDPSVSTLRRFASLTDINTIHYYRDMRSFLDSE